MPISQAIRRTLTSNRDLQTNTKISPNRYSKSTWRRKNNSLQLPPRTEPIIILWECHPFQTYPISLTEIPSAWRNRRINTVSNNAEAGGPHNRKAIRAWPSKLNQWDLILKGPLLLPEKERKQLGRSNMILKYLQRPSKPSTTPFLPDTNRIAYSSQTWQTNPTNHCVLQL